MSATKVLYISQEVMPYLPETEMSKAGRYLPQLIQEKGKEIRTFMPKFGGINERRNQLHEVIRLSGMNIIIEDTDHPLIIKVASIQSARMQVYFIDNEDFFQKRNIVADDNGVEYSDNDERCIFYIRGVLETVKKLKWIPDVIHCSGWVSALAPLYIKKAYADDPCYKNSKIVWSLYDDAYQSPFPANFKNKLVFDGITDPDLTALDGDVTFEQLSKLAIDHADGVVQMSENVIPELVEYTKSKNLPFLGYAPYDTIVDQFNEFYDNVWNNSNAK